MNEMRKAAEAKDMKELNEGVHHLRSSWMQIESRKQGLGEETDGGTLFLEEIGNLPTEVQQMLLRALESKMYRPMDGNRDKKADVRVTATTNEDLPTAIAEKRFRVDLYQ